MTDSSGETKDQAARGPEQTKPPPDSIVDMTPPSALPSGPGESRIETRKRERDLDDLKAMVRGPSDSDFTELEFTPPVSGGGVKPARRSGGDFMPPEVERIAADPEIRLNQYILAEQIGAGGMGSVWKAWDTKLTRWVAIKQLSILEEGGVVRFEREAKLSARLRHPNICGVHEVNEARGRHFLVLEYIDGTSLARATLSRQALLEAFVKVCRAIDYAHKTGIVHRDLKPANIMVNREGEPFVTDFGLAKALQTDSSISVSGSILGTPAYMPPEQASGKLDQVDERSDIYSLGATLYMLMTGKPPFEAGNPTSLLIKVCSEDPLPPRKRKPDLPAPLEFIILKALEKEKSRRYSTASALADDVQRFLNDESILAKPPHLLAAWVRRVRRNPLAAVGVLAIAAASLVVSWNLMRPAPAAGPVTATPAPSPTRSPEEVWLADFEKGKPALGYENFLGLEARDQNSYRMLFEKVPPAVAPEAVEWLRHQMAQTPQTVWPKSEWISRRPQADKTVRWCSTVLALVDGVAGLESLPGLLSEMATRFAPVLVYRGRVTLKFLPWPYAHLKYLSSGGQSAVIDGVARPEVRLIGLDPTSPIIVENVEIADLEITWSHPELGEGNLFIPADRLKDGESYLYSGDLSRPESFRLKSLSQ